jgi:hypothetical protein
MLWSVMLHSFMGVMMGDVMMLLRLHANQPRLLRSGGSEQTES